MTLDLAVLLTLAANLVAMTYYFARIQIRLDGIERTVEHRLAAIETRLASLELRMGILEQRLADLTARFDRLEGRVDIVVRRIDQSSYVPSEAAAGKR
jgi:uncharacterized coiled-coil protein SlyX